MPSASRREDTSYSCDDVGPVKGGTQFADGVMTFGRRRWRSSFSWRRDTTNQFLWMREREEEREFNRTWKCCCDAASIAIYTRNEINPALHSDWFYLFSLNSRRKGGKPPLGKNASADAKVVAEKLLWGAAQSSEDGIDRWLLEIYAFVVTRAAPFFGRHIHQHNQYRRLLEG